MLLLIFLACGAPDPCLVFPDADGDGYGNGQLSVAVCDADGIDNYVANDQDCDDSDSAIYPGASGDACDGLDNDCDGTVGNESGVEPTWFADLDGDGFGDLHNPIYACERPEHYVDNSDDCNDHNNLIHPGGVDSSYDGVDQDCSGDDADDRCDETVAYTEDLTIHGSGASETILELCWRYNTISGDLLVSGTDLINDDALNCFCSFEGDVTISDNPLLESVSLRSRSGTTIEDNPALVSVRTSSPESGEATVRRNPVLTSVEVSVSEVAGDISVRDNASLETLTISSDGYSSVLDNLLIVNNPSLNQISWCRPEWSTNNCSLADVLGSILIEDNDALTSLGFLGAVETIGWDITVSRNPSLAQVTLPSLDTVGGSFTIWNNDALHAVGDFHHRMSLSSIGRDFVIGGNTALRDMDYFQMPDVGGSVFLWDMLELNSTLYWDTDPRHIGGDLIIQDVPADMHMFSEVETIGGDVRLENTYDVSLGSLKTIGGSLLLQGSEYGTTYLGSLTDIQGDISVLDMHDTRPAYMPVLESLGGSMTIEECSRIVDLSDFGVVDSIGDLKITENSALVSLGGLEGADFVGYVAITKNASLENVDALAGKTSLNSLYISGNDSLTSLAGLSSLTTVTGTLQITENPLLASFTGLESLETVSSYVQLFSGPTDMTGLSSLESVGGLWVKQPYGYTQDCTFESLAGLERLETISGKLSIDTCGSLVSLDGLEALTSLNDLSLYSNVLLEDISALHGVSFMSGDFFIVSNSSLPDASVDALEDVMKIRGSVTVSDNGG